MAIVYKPKDRKVHYYKVRIGPNRWKRYPGFVDRRATEEQCRKHQAMIDRGEVNLLNPYEGHNKRPVLDHLTEYLNELAATGHDTDNNRVVELRLKKMLNTCGWNYLPDISIASFTRFRDTGDMLNAAPKTRNDYQQTARQFCRWCVRNGRMPVDPFQNLATVKVNGDIRRQRRALTDAEVNRLLEVSPEPRKTVYMAALLTGLRRGELRQLRWSDVHLDAPKPFLTARASTTKNAREAVIFLRDDLVAALREMDHPDDGNDLLFRVPKRVTFYKDLLAAGIARRDKQGRTVDFHALRHTLATNLGRAGVSVQTAMQVMRHSDIRLTTKTYTDATLLPTAEAIEVLPRWEANQQIQEAIKDGTSDMALPSVTKTGSQRLNLVPGSSHGGALMESENHQAWRAQNHDYQGVCEPPENMRPLGIEPRTHRLKVCCSTS